MPSLEQLRQLAEAPAWVLLIMVVGAILIGAIRKPPWWVPFWFMARETLRADRNDEALVNMTTAITALEKRLARVEHLLDARRARAKEGRDDA